MNQKQKKAIASASGQAGALYRQAEKLQASARIPYQCDKRSGTAVCSVCEQQLAWHKGLSVIPHTPKTCPGPAARVQMG